MCKTRGSIDPEQHLTDEEMNELVFADVNDPSAWDDPIVVPASKGERRIKRAKPPESNAS